MISGEFSAVQLVTKSLLYDEGEIGGCYCNLPVCRILVYASMDYVGIAE